MVWGRPYGDVCIPGVDCAESAAMPEEGAKGGVLFADFQSERAEAPTLRGEALGHIWSCSTDSIEG